jgi:transposase-like protein
MKKVLATAVTAAVLATGGVAVAGAASDSGSSGSSTSAPRATAAAESTPHPRRHRRLHVVQVGLATSAKAIGISTKDLVAELRKGSSIAEVAQAHGVDPKTVEDAIVAAANARIDQAVENGKLDEARAATLKEKVAARAEQFVEQTPKLGERERRVGHPLAVAAKAIGVDRSDLIAALRDGKTIAQVAQEHDVDPQTVIDALVKAGQARLEQRAEHFVNETHHRK